MKQRKGGTRKTAKCTRTVSNSVWTINEKRKLLQALTIHSTLDATILQQHIPQKSVQEVRRAIEDYMGQRAVDIASAATLSNNNSKEEKALQWWLERCSQELGNRSESSQLVPTILEALALMEEDTSSFSYGKVYAYLGAAARGLKTMYLQPDEAYLLVEQLKDLARTVDTLDTHYQMAYLRDKYVAPQAVAAGGRVASDNCPDLILASTAGADGAVVTENSAGSPSHPRSKPNGVPEATPQSCSRTAAAANVGEQAGMPRGSDCDTSASHTILAQDAACFTPLASRVTLSSLEHELLKFKCYNPLDIPNFLLQFHCKPTFAFQAGCKTRNVYCGNA